MKKLTRSIINLDRVFFLLLLILISLGQFQRIELANSIAIYVHEILMAVWIFFNLFNKNKNWKKYVKNLDINKYRFEIILLVWLGSGILLAVINNKYLLKNFLYLIRIIFYLVFAINLWISKKQIYYQHKKMQQLCIIRYGFIYTGLLIMLIGFSQYIFFPDTRFLKIQGWDDHYYRLISSQFDPGFAGLIFVLTLIFLNSLNFKYIYLIADTLLIGAISLTFSRASYLSLWVSLLLLQIKKIKRSSQSYLVYTLYLIISIFTIFIAPKPAGEGVNLTRNSSINARVMNVKENLTSLTGEEWIFGQGLFVNQNIDRELVWQDVPYHANTADNILVFILKSSGIIGLILSLTIMIKYLIILFKRDYYIFTALIAILIHSQFNASLLQNFIMLFLIGGIVSINCKKKILRKESSGA